MTQGLINIFDATPIEASRSGLGNSLMVSLSAKVIVTIRCRRQSKYVTVGLGWYGQEGKDYSLPINNIMA